MKSANASRLTCLLVVIAALSVFLWSYWTTIAELQYKWSHDPLYSHGYLVPLVSLALVWTRRSQLDLSQLYFTPWGLTLVLAAGAMRVIGTYYYAMWFDSLSMILSLVGLCAMFGGSRALRFAWPGLVFLLYMLPLPYRIEIGLGSPLQRLATLASVYVLQTLGCPAIAEGNVIHFNDTQIGIVEACSGLRMLVVFYAVATAVAFVIRRPLSQKVLIFSSALPIALITNVARITITGIVHDQFRNATLNHYLHDWAGFLMMPTALVLLGIELWALSRAITIETTEPIPVRP